MQMLVNKQKVPRLIVVFLIMAGIFAFDTLTQYEVAAAVFYSGVILLASRYLEQKGLIWLAVACVTLTVVSFALTPTGHRDTGLINMMISIAAIAITTGLIVRMESALSAAQQAKDRLLRYARVKSLEGLASSIAHEVSQPMAAIMTSANAGKRWLTHVPPNLERVETSLERILSDASRASAIIDRMRSLATGEVTKKSEFDFNQAVLEIINTSKPQMQKNNIVLVTDLQLDLPKAVADRIQIQQVVGNLILNAIDAVNKVPAHRRNIRVSSEKRDGRILLSVQDSGVGIKAEDFPHLFEPFWTDKPEGLGIGLSICRSIVENNGGQIWAEHPGRKGAVFRFTVPACE